MFSLRAKISFAALLAILLGSEKGFSFEVQNWSSRQIYDATYEACSQAQENDLSGRSLEFDRLYAGITRSYDFNRLLSSLSRESLKQSFTQMKLFTRSEAVIILQNHPSYQGALAQCYPDRLDLQKKFNRLVLQRDIAGKSMGIALQVGLAAVTSPVVARLPQWIQWSLGAVVFGSSTYTISQSILHAKKTSDHLKACAQEKGITESECSKMMFQESLKALQSSLSLDQVDETIAKMKKNYEDKIQELRAAVSQASDVEKRRAAEEAILTYETLVRTLTEE